MKSAIAIRHLGFEDLGAFAAPLRAAGYAIAYRDIGADDLTAPDIEAAELLVVLGGPIGVYEDATYPFLRQEIALLEKRLAGDRPTLGICLGAQLIARAAGARVYPSGIKEIGFAPIALTDAGRASCLAPFAEEPLTLHWHGDTFDLPDGAQLLASTGLTRHQAFSLGPNAIGFQFHPEAGAGNFEAWLIGHTAELHAAKIDIAGLREDGRRHGPTLARKAETVITRWLAGLTL